MVKLSIFLSYVCDLTTTSLSSLLFQGLMRGVQGNNENLGAFEK